MPQFTPLQLKLHIRGHHDLGFNLISKKPVEVERPTPVILRDRIPRCQPQAGPSNIDVSSSSTSTHVKMAAKTPPSLLQISSLPTAPIKTIISALNTLFEPSTELHTLALPAIQSARRTVPANPGIFADLPPPAGAPKAAIPNPHATSPSLLESYESLIRHIGTLLSQLADSETHEANRKLRDILGSHPRLGAKKVDSAQSQAEQAQLSTGGAEDAEKLRVLNDEYEASFPGLRYVVFVNGRSRSVIMEDMRRRIDRGDAKEEEKEAIRAMVDIALDRAGKLQTAS